MYFFFVVGELPGWKISRSDGVSIHVVWVPKFLGFLLQRGRSLLFGTEGILVCLPVTAARSLSSWTCPSSSWIRRWASGEFWTSAPPHMEQ